MSDIFMTFSQYVIYGRHENLIEAAGRKKVLGSLNFTQSTFASTNKVP